MRRLIVATAIVTLTLFVFIEASAPRGRVTWGVVDKERAQRAQAQIEDAIEADEKALAGRQSVRAGDVVQLGDISARLTLAEGAAFPVLELRNDRAEAQPFGELILRVNGPDGFGQAAPFGGEDGWRFGVLVGGAIDVNRDQPPGVWTSIDPPFSIPPGGSVELMRFHANDTPVAAVFDLSVGAPQPAPPGAAPTPAAVPRSQLATDTARKEQRALGTGCPIVSVNHEVVFPDGRTVRARVERGRGGRRHVVVEQRGGPSPQDLRSAWVVTRPDGATISDAWPPPTTADAWAPIALPAQVDQGAVVVLTHHVEGSESSVLFDLADLPQ